MRQLSILLFFVTLFSCKTINITEKNILKVSKYDFEKYSKEIENSNKIKSEKAYLITLLSNLIKTDKEEILDNKELKINRKYFIISDTVKLEYFEFESKSATQAGLYFLGNASSITDNFFELGKLATETHSRLYILNYRGYGKSEGFISFNTIFTDNQSFFNFIKENNKKVNYIIGHSFGSISATALAVDNNLENLILLAPVSDTKEFVSLSKKRMTTGIKSLMRPFIKITTDTNLQKISNIEKIKSYNGNLLILHAKDDKALPYQMGKAVFEFCPSKHKELITIEQGGHFAAFENMNWAKIIERLR